MSESFTIPSPDAVKKPGEGIPRRNALYAQGLVKLEEITNLHENLLNGLKISGGTPFLGHRVITNGKAGEYKWETYQQVFDRVQRLGSYFVSLKLKKDATVGLFSINRPEWVIAEHACYMYSYITVPLYDTLGADAIQHIVSQTELSVIVCTSDKAKTVIEMKKSKSLSSVTQLILMDGEPSGTLETAAKSANIQILSIQEAEKQGSTKICPAQPMPSDGIATICYTSGTTGLPKGVILTHRNILTCGLAGKSLMTKGQLYQISNQDVHISYLPLAHIFERVVQVMLTHFGGQIGFYQGDALKLLEDVAELKPTMFCSVPRLFNRLYDKVLAGVKAKGGLAAYLFNTAYAHKLYYLKNPNSSSWVWDTVGGVASYLLGNGLMGQGSKPSTCSHTVWDRVVFGAVRAKLGGRVRMMVTGAAPISAEVVDFLRICFSAEFYEGYGQTETAAALAMTNRFDLESGHVGVPFPCTEVKLVDVPSMNYSSEDKPYPRGEVCVKGDSVFIGYYKEKEKTKETIDKDGWCHTGDVGMWDGKGRLKIIDRVKNIFKLSQGEYIAPEKIEMVYVRHELVAQAFVYGDSLQSTLVAIIVPDAETLKPWAKQNGFGDKSLADYCNDKTLMAEILKQITAHAKNELKGFELVKAIRLSPELFSMENDLLTPTFKLKRFEAKKHFQSQIDAMYAEIATQ